MAKTLVPALRMKSPPKALLLSGLTGAVALAIVVPLQIQDRVEVPARVLATQEWVVTRDANGAVSATLRDYQTGAVRATFAAEPERGDAVQFYLGPAASKRSVSAGDTVGGFVSEETALRLTAIGGEVEAARAELDLAQAGEKDALVEASRQELLRAEATLEYSVRVEERQRALFERGIIAERELEEAESERRVAEAETAAARAMLDATQTGARAEQVALAQARLDALEREAASLQDRQRMSTLVAPISGLVYNMVSSDTLLMVADTATYAVMLPVRWSDRDRVAPGHEVRLRVTEWGEQPRARVMEVRESAGRAAGQAYLVAMAEVYEGKEALMPGLLVQGSIETGELSLFGYADRVLRDLFRW